MLLPADLKFRREELSELLQWKPAVVDALAGAGETVAAADLERFLRDSLLRLYQAQAMRSVGTTMREAEVEFDLEEPVEEESPIVRTASDEIAAAASEPRSNLRVGVRYIPRRPIHGTFREVKFAMLQLSSSGLRIRHDEPLRAGDEARLMFTILNPPKSFVMRARVVWTSIAQRGEERSYYISGLRVTENTDRLVNAAYLLRTARELIVDDRDLGRRLPNTRSVPAQNMPRHVNGLSDEDVVTIIQAVRTLADNPEEAARWYARARFAIADEEVRKAAPRGAREREEVVGVWEYLHRRTDLKTVAGVMQWIRNSKVASV